MTDGAGTEPRRHNAFLYLIGILFAALILLTILTEVRGGNDQSTSSYVPASPSQNIVPAKPAVPEPDLGEFVDVQPREVDLDGDDLKEYVHVLINQTAGDYLVIVHDSGEVYAVLEHSPSIKGTYRVVDLQAGDKCLEIAVLLGETGFRYFRFMDEAVRPVKDTPGGPAPPEIQPEPVTPSEDTSYQLAQYYCRPPEQADLDGDSVPDGVFILTNMNEQGYVVIVNDAIICGTAEDPAGGVVDIDINDSLQEIAIGTGWEVLYFWYNQGSLESAGSIDSDIQKYVGDGTIITHCRGTILCTWWYEGVFQLDGNHHIFEIPQMYYPMHSYGGTDGWLPVRTSLRLQKSPTDPTTVLNLRMGERIRLIKTDNKKWILAETESGVKGWFTPDDWDWRQDLPLEGLNMAG